MVVAPQVKLILVDVSPMSHLDNTFNTPFSWKNLNKIKTNLVNSNIWRMFLQEEKAMSVSNQINGYPFCWMGLTLR